MKKFFTLLTLVTMVMTMFTSCEDSDASEARTLDGSWTGTIETYYRDRWGYYGNAYRSTLYFDQINRYGGIGYQVDYDINSPYDDYYYCEFDWDVYNGEIRISYADSYNPVFIYDYVLYNDYFKGYMDDGTSRGIYFQLYYDYNFNWAPYRYYYAPTRSGETPRYHASGSFAEKIKEASK